MASLIRDADEGRFDRESVRSAGTRRAVGFPLKQEIKFANTKNPRFSHCMPAGADFCLERVAVLLDDPVPLLMVSPRHRHPI